MKSRTKSRSFEFTMAKEDEDDVSSAIYDIIGRTPRKLVSTRALAWRDWVYKGPVNYYDRSHVFRTKVDDGVTVELSFVLSEDEWDIDAIYKKIRRLSRGKPKFAVESTVVFMVTTDSRAAGHGAG